MIRIYENNLLWSQRLKLSLADCGDELEIFSKPLQAGTFEQEHALANVRIAIVNLGSNQYDAPQLIQFLKRNHVKIIAHAGHKEGTLLDAGKTFGADLVVTNRELTVRASALVNEFLRES